MSNYRPALPHQSDPQQENLSGELVRPSLKRWHATLSSCQFLSGVTVSWWRGCEVARGGFVMQPCYVTPACGQLRGRLLCGGH